MAPVAHNDKGYFASDDQITVSEYIYRRILQLEVKSVFGVPGDFILSFCDEIKKTPELNWVGTCNELNGSYAADGYAKTSGKIGVFVSTFGVGELSAINGISGAFLEYAPVLHIVGTSSRSQKTDKRSYHHLIPQKNSRTPNHYVYENMVDSVCIVKESLSDISIATKQIDNAIEQVYKKLRPGYIFLPSDMATCMVSAERLYTPLDLTEADLNPELTEKIVQNILQRLYLSKSPAVIVDYLVKPFRQQEQISKLMSKLDSKVNLFTMTLSKGFVDESHPRFGGLYAGKHSQHPETSELIENSDFVLDIGSFDVQNNSGFFSTKYQQDALIEMNEYMILVGEKELYEANFTHVLLRLVDSLDSALVPACAPLVKPTAKIASHDLNGDLNEDFLASSLEKYLKPNDILVVETCSFLFTVPDLDVPDNFRLVTQNFYNSIGYALPATIGVFLANKELGYSEEESRVVLVQGDGSLLMTLQELMTYLRQDVKLKILLLNNDGYTVERVILGTEALYNDIPANIQWTKIFEAFGDVTGKLDNLTIKTKMELHNLFKGAAFASGSNLQMVELCLDRMDVPETFKKLISS